MINLPEKHDLFRLLSRLYVVWYKTPKSMFHFITSGKVVFVCFMSQFVSSDGIITKYSDFIRKKPHMELIGHNTRNETFSSSNVNEVRSSRDLSKLCNNLTFISYCNNQDNCRQEDSLWKKIFY